MDLELEGRRAIVTGGSRGIGLAVGRVLATEGARVALVECGAGTAVPTVRRFCEAMAAHLNGALVRINVREPEVERRWTGESIGIPMGALAALREIDRLMTQG